jgi:hypothetical protein
MEIFRSPLEAVALLERLPLTGDSAMPAESAWRSRSWFVARARANCFNWSSEPRALGGELWRQGAQPPQEIRHGERSPLLKLTSAFFEFFLPSRSSSAARMSAGVWGDLEVVGDPRLSM